MNRKLQKQIIKALDKPLRFHNRTYEKRVRINGIDIYACAADPDECTSRFLDDLQSKLLLLQDENSMPSKTKSNKLFAEWAEIWFNEVFKPDVTPGTYLRDYGRYEKHILPILGDKPIRLIMPLDCIRVFNVLKEKNLERTAEGCYGNLKRIFDFAVDSGAIRSNPMKSIKPIKHERKNGIPLSKEEEQKFLERIKGMKYEAVFILALYTGLRPCEYETARIEGDFIVAQNRKQKNVKKIVFKKIPITPMLRPYIPLIESNMPIWAELTVKSGKRACWQFQEMISNHKMYDLRTTFATRCQECGVSETVVQTWMGHSPRTLLGKVYTKYSDEYLLSEGKKVKY